MSWPLWLRLLACGAQEPARCEPNTQVLEIRAAGCLAFDSGRLLLVQQNNGRWSIPGGYVERGEEGPAAAVRETWEEARVKVTAGIPRCAVASNRFVAYVCVPEPGGVPFADGDETRDARFMTRDEIASLKPEEMRFPEQQQDYLREIDLGP